MILSVRENGDVKSIPSHITQGSFVHDVTVIAPFVNVTCILRLKPPSEEWLEDIVMAPTLTADGRGAIFTGSIPDKVATVAGRLLYHLEFVGRNGESVSSESGSINVLPGVITDMPDSVDDLSQYSLNQIYALLSRISGNVIGMKKSVGKMMTSIPLTVTIPASSWVDNSVAVAVPEVQAESVVSVSYTPSQAEEFAEAGIMCTGKADGVLTFSCENIPVRDISVQLLIMDVLRIEEGDDEPPAEEEKSDPDEETGGGDSTVKADYVTPQDYGAVGDGETDDYAAFAAMFDAAPNNIYIPAGKYYISSPVTLQANTRHIRGAGFGMTIVYCSNGFLSSGDTVMYYCHIHDMSILDKDNGSKGCGISGKFAYSQFFNLKMYYLESGFQFKGNSWINSIHNCEVAYCNCAIVSLAESFNNVIVRDTAFQHNETVYSNQYMQTNVVFDGCDVERNTTVFDIGDSRAFTVCNTYLELNEVIFTVSLAAGSDYSLKNCFIYANIETPGWLAMLPTSDSIATAAVLNIEKCYIRHISEDVEPFAFYDGYQYSRVAVNIHDCRFYFKPSVYFDLFDLTNCAHYGDCWNRLPIDTDLIFHQEGDLRWYIHNGNSYDRLGTETVLEMIGTYPGYSVSAHNKFAVTVSNRVGKVGGEALLGGTIFIDNGEATPVIAFLSETSEGGLVFSMPSTHDFTADSVAHIHIKY